MADELIRLQTAAGLAHITLARPAAYNAMNYAFVDAFAETCAGLENGAVRAVLITAEGKNFCVGGDLKAFANEPEPGPFLMRIAARLHEGMKALLALDAPLVVAVQGAAAGAGMSLAALGDIVLAGTQAHFTAAYTGVGLTADGGATWSLPRVVGLRVAQEMLLLNRRLSAVEAQSVGLVTRVVDDEALVDEATKVGQQLAAGPTRSYGKIRRLLQASSQTSFEQQLDTEALAIGEAARDDGREGFAAFFERRKPNFRG